MKRRQPSIVAWIKTHRAEVDAEILRQCPNVGRLNDRERHLWVLNWEPLYLLAKASGVGYINRRV
jgi:hypothetical protein